MELKPEDLVMNNWSGVRKSGWSVTPDNGVSILHRPTGAMVQVDTERSQHANKAIAMKMLEAKVQTLMEERARPPAPSAAAGEQVDWMECERISNEDHVDEALRTFSDDPTQDNATGVIQAVITVYKADRVALAAQPTPAQGGKEGA